jgi:hypothetical protein
MKSMTPRQPPPEEATMAGKKKATKKATTTTTTTPQVKAAGEQACPRCGAKGDEPCRHPSGRVRGGGRRHRERDTQPIPPPPLRLAVVGKAGTVTHVAEGDTTVCGRPVSAANREYERADLRNGVVSCQRCRKVLDDDQIEKVEG